MTATGAAARRERARQEMREAILESTRRLIATEGIAHLSMRAIARDLGYSPAALYEYFPAREDVCRALYFEGADGLAGRMARALAALPADVSPAEAMGELGRAYRAYALENSELFRLVFSSTVAGFTPNEIELGRSKGGFDLLIATARRGIEAGQFVSMPPEVVAAACWASVHGFVMLELSGLLAARAGTNASEGAGSAELDALFETKLRLLATGVLRRETPVDSR
ncbi:MAG TPA: TetR/AcrR family transcriptional regulator [Thermomicrobiales bacterium]